MQRFAVIGNLGYRASSVEEKKVKKLNDHSIGMISCEQVIHRKKKKVNSHYTIEKTFNHIEYRNEN